MKRLLYTLNKPFQNDLHRSWLRCSSGHVHHGLRLDSIDSAPKVPENREMNTLPRCGVHGLTLPPNGDCILCAKESPQKESDHPRRSGRFIVVLLMVLALFLTSIAFLRNMDQPGIDDPSAANKEAGVPSIPDEGYFYGEWTMTSCAGTFYTTIRPNGTTTTRLQRKNESTPGHLSSGTWKLRKTAIVWIFDQSTSRTRRGAEDVNEIVSINENSFTVLETNGQRTTLKRVK
ncbi:MAG: hypothetical protein GY854_18525 [Deltaproteobacteria bacterium]|nr:hypothetical protein [Deltaproteobacteria bacterium]